MLKQLISKLKSPKIEIFVRHCYYSSASAKKNRIEGFSHEKCHQNFLETTDFKHVNVTFVLDTHFSDGKEHFVQQQSDFPVIEIDAGSETCSFLALLDYVIDQPFSNETLIYFLEDDYLHRPGWVNILREGLTLEGVDYVTLFDHRDKYEFEEYQTLQSKLYYTNSCHWRTTPSTTNTYAMHFKTLKNDFDIHREFSSQGQITQDHQKFLKLGEHGRTLISPIPGFSTHVESDFVSPCTNWQSYFS